MNLWVKWRVNCFNVGYLDILCDPFDQNYGDIAHLCCDFSFKNIWAQLSRCGF